MFFLRLKDLLKGNELDKGNIVNKTRQGVNRDENIEITMGGPSQQAVYVAKQWENFTNKIFVKAMTNLKDAVDSIRM